MVKGIQIGKEVKLSLFEDDMILYIENPKEATKKLLLERGLYNNVLMYKLLLLSRFSRVWLCATP